LFGHWAHYSSQIGADGEAELALEKIKSLAEQDSSLKADADRAILGAENNQAILKRISETCFVFPNVDENTKSEIESEHASLQDANKRIFEPLLSWWDEGFEALGEIYDYWGRGNFAQLLHNAQKHTGNFNLTLEVRSLDDVKQAVRLWGLYTDFLMLIWKGPVKTLGMSMVPLGDPYIGGIGGHGYILSMGSEIKGKNSEKIFYPAACFASTHMPDEVVRFLATEAKPFLERGKLLVVPATAIGCLHPGHGPFEQLLADAVCAIPTMRANGKIESPIGVIPYSSDAPLHVLAELADQESTTLARLRATLKKRSNQQPDIADRDAQINTKLMEMEIADALREIKSHLKIESSKKNFANIEEPLGTTYANYRNHGTVNTPDLTYSPLLTLENLGYRWHVGKSTQTKQKIRFEPSEKQIVGTWLVPAECGLLLAAVKRV
jgi:hypothetical protein